MEDISSRMLMIVTMSDGSDLKNTYSTTIDTMSLSTFYLAIEMINNQEIEMKLPLTHPRNVNRAHTYMY